jgi:hypothetical protein
MQETLLGWMPLFSNFSQSFRIGFRTFARPDRQLSHIHLSAIRTPMSPTPFIIGLALLASPAAAHDQWLDGEQVDPVLKLLCCGPDDTRIVDNLVRFSADGDGIYFVDMPGFRIPFSRVQPSPDGHWWRSFDASEETWTIRCVFGPYGY